MLSNNDTPLVITGQGDYRKEYTPKLDRPDRQPVMELLCLLSTTPARMRWLRYDLHIRSYAELERLIGRLVGLGIEVITHETGSESTVSENTVRIAHRCWPKARQLAETYWNARYGGAQ